MQEHKIWSKASLKGASYPIIKGGFTPRDFLVQPIRLHWENLIKFHFILYWCVKGNVLYSSRWSHAAPKEQTNILSIYISLYLLYGIYFISCFVFANILERRHHISLELLSLGRLMNKPVNKVKWRQLWFSALILLELMWKMPPWYEQTECQRYWWMFALYQHRRNALPDI